MPTGPAARDPLERIMEKVFKRSDGCWIWLGFTNPEGYGRININNKNHLVHRWLFEYINGSIGKLECCHHCDITNCINPDHMFAGTRLENMQDAVIKKRSKRYSITHCPNGHEYSEENTRIVNNCRWCRACDQMRARAKYIKRKIKL